MAKYKKKVI